jgi:hypothetical protein
MVLVLGILSWNKALLWLAVLAIMIGVAIISLVSLDLSQSDCTLAVSKVYANVSMGSINATNPVWVKTIQSTGGLPFLKNDIFLTTAVRSGYGGWLSGKGWWFTVEVLSVGAARQNGSDNRVGMLKSQSFTCLGTLENRTGYASPTYLLAYPTGGQPFTWWDTGPYLQQSSTLSHIAIGDINRYTTFGLNASQLITAVGDVPRSDRATVWQYSAMPWGGASDCGYYAVLADYIRPGQTVDSDINTTLYWGLSHATGETIHVKITVPPDPDNMTPAERERYGIIVYTPPSSNPYEVYQDQYYYTGNLSAEVSFG